MAYAICSTLWNMVLNRSNMWYVVIPFILDVTLVDTPAGVTREEDHTGFFIHLPSAVLDLIFLARRIQPSLSLVDRESRILCTHEIIVPHCCWAYNVRKNPSSCDCAEIRTHVPTSEGVRDYQTEPPGRDRLMTWYDTVWYATVTGLLFCTLLIIGDPKREPHLIVTRDWNGPNSGVILMKNSDFSRWLLKEWWDQDQFVKGHFPFQYEQVSRRRRYPS